MDDARALLNSLMGADRNEMTQTRKVRSFKDDDNCRHFLLGLCPHDLFKNTKIDLGPCDKDHNEHIKEAFEAHAEKAHYNRKWRASLINNLRTVLQGVDRRILMNQVRLDKEKAGGGIGASEEAKQQMAQLKEEVSEKLQQAEKAADEGKFEESRNIMKDSEAAKRKLEDLEMKRFEKYKKENICDICGLIIDAQEAEDMKTGRGWHSNGKQHIGYKMIREKLKQLEDERARDRKNGVRTPSPSPVRVQKAAPTSGRNGKKKSRSRSKVGKKKSKSRSRSRRRKDDRRRKGSRSRSGRRKSPTRSAGRGRKKDGKRRASSSPRRSASRKRRDRSKKKGRSKVRSPTPHRKQSKTKDKSPKRRSSSNEERPRKTKGSNAEESRPKIPSEPSRTAVAKEDAKPQPPPMEEPKPPPEEKPPEPPAPEPDIDEVRPRVAFVMGFTKR